MDTGNWSSKLGKKNSSMSFKVKSDALTMRRDTRGQQYEGAEGINPRDSLAIAPWEL